jgi:hypothetical protein
VASPPGGFRDWHPGWQGDASSLWPQVRSTYQTRPREIAPTMSVSTSSPPPSEGDLKTLSEAQSWTTIPWPPGKNISEYFACTVVTVQ